MATLSAILPVYRKNNPAQVKAALDSILAQTRLPDELLVVTDGPVSADCLPERFETQMKCFEEHPEVSVVGGQIVEFDGAETNITGRRRVPLRHEDIAAYMKSRNAMNHVTTIIRRKDLLAAGNYQPLNWLEDYYLWVRMLQQGYRFMNVPDDVVLVRAGKAQTDRRGGWNYFYYENKLFRYMRSVHFISWWRYLFNIVERGCVRLLMPLTMRYWFYRTFLR